VKAKSSRGQVPFGTTAAPGRSVTLPGTELRTDMAGPAWLTVGLASLMLLIAASSACRLAISWLRGGRTDPETDGLHVLMGVAMAGMLEPGLSPLPYAAWLAVFAVGATWFTWRAGRTRTHARTRSRRGNHPHPVAHVVECGAMIYMLLPGSAAGHGTAMAMPGMSTPAANPAVTLILAMFMLGYILWTADQLTARTPGRAPARPAAAVLSPRLAACSEIVMSVAMGYMLIAML
jgi:Domain of unknown function (DUF5134)